MPCVGGIDPRGTRSTHRVDVTTVPADCSERSGDAPAAGGRIHRPEKKALADLGPE